ncbi:MAG: hypothetical protein E6J09_13720 [Chloroflexi bacterium]|nr:MAG: hypothetical protein E6J09_13720 [Chloroflexota bacterium]
MKLFARGCGLSQLPYTARAEDLSIRDRFEIEAHAATCPECAAALREVHSVDAALRSAFAPLRERRATLAPGRVRLALNSRRVERSTLFRLPRVFGRLAEVSVMVGVTLFVIGGSVEYPQSVAPQQPRSIIQDYFRKQPPTDEIDYFRWLRLNRTESAMVVSDPVRFPDGGRYDFDLVEPVRAPTASPR